MNNLQRIGIGLLVATVFLTLCVHSQEVEEIEIFQLLAEYNKVAAAKSRQASLASWAVATDVGDTEKEEKKVSKVQ